MNRLGFWSSLICAIHCTILPLVLILIPTSGVYLFINETFELVFLIVSLLINIANLCFGYKVHKSNKALGILASGLFLFLVGRLLHKHNDEHIIQYDLFNFFMILGGVMMAFSSLINTKMCNTCKKCECKKDG
jgi:L-asparagine transporter-like permease